MLPFECLVLNMEPIQERKAKWRPKRSSQRRQQARHIQIDGEFRNVWMERKKKHNASRFYVVFYFV